jgi:hypothetical protein
MIHSTTTISINITNNNITKNTITNIITIVLK